MNKNIKWIVVSFCLLIFCFISFMILTDNDIFLDYVFYDFVFKYFISDYMTNVMKVITWFGSTIGIILMCFLSLFIFRNKRINILTVCNLITSVVLNNLLKIIFMRIRPDINPLVIEDSYSFPSGHSMISIVFYGYLTYLIYTYYHNNNIKWLLIVIISILILLIGFSRIYLGVHYVSDVIGGFTFGIAYLIIFIYLSKNILNKK